MNTDLDTIDSAQAQELLHYKDSSSFRRACIELDIPRFKVNSRKTLFSKQELKEWLIDRREGRPAC